MVLSLAVAEVGARLFLPPPRNVGPAFSVYDPVLMKRLKPSLD